MSVLLDHEIFILADSLENCIDLALGESTYLLPHCVSRSIFDINPPKMTFVDDMLRNHLKNFLTRDQSKAGAIRYHIEFWEIRLSHEPASNDVLKKSSTFRARIKALCGDAPLKEHPSFVLGDARDMRRIGLSIDDHRAYMKRAVERLLDSAV